LKSYGTPARRIHVFDVSIIPQLSNDVVPFGIRIRIGGVGKDGPHGVFPCRQIPGGWINAKLKKWIDVRPTHWREWVEKR
jgi:hypothetical protein